MGSGRRKGRSTLTGTNWEKKEILPKHDLLHLGRNSHHLCFPLIAALCSSSSLNCTHFLSLSLALGHVWMRATAPGATENRKVFPSPAPPPGAAPVCGGGACECFCVTALQEPPLALPVETRTPDECGKRSRLDDDDRKLRRKCRIVGKNQEITDAVAGSTAKLRLPLFAVWFHTAGFPQQSKHEQLIQDNKVWGTALQRVR